MKVLIAGGTGFIGKALCRFLASLGHQISVLSRQTYSPEDFPILPWDGRRAGNWCNAMGAAEAVINLSGESVAQGRWTAERKIALRESRILAVQALVSAMSQAKNRPKVFISASGVGYYGDRGDEELSEESGPGRDFLSTLCQDWEREALKAKDLSVRTVCLRIGVVLGPGGGALAKMLFPFRMGVGGPLGSGDQWMSWISREDLAGLTEHILRSDLEGAINATAPDSVTNGDFSAALGQALRRPSWLRAPAFALRLALGEMADMLLASQKAIPVKALKSQYIFKHPDIASALKASLP